MAQRQGDRHLDPHPGGGRRGLHPRDHHRPRPDRRRCPPAELEARSRYHNAVTLRLSPDQAARAEAVVTAVAGVVRVALERRGHGQAGALAEMVAFPAAGAEILEPVSRAIEAAGSGSTSCSSSTVGSTRSSAS